MKKFKTGDKARIKYVRNNNCERWHAGLVVTIKWVENGVTPIGNLYEYVLTLPNGSIARVLGEQLEPLVPDKVSWKEIESEFGWNPTKEKVV